MTDFTKILQPGDTVILRDKRRAVISAIEVNAPDEIEFVIQGYAGQNDHFSWTRSGSFLGEGDFPESGMDIIEREEPSTLIPVPTTPEKVKELTYQTPDRNGETPDLSILGERKRHSGNGKIYTIVAFSWNGDTDEWNNVHIGPDGILINRPLDHWTGRRANGEMRYSEAL